MSASGLFLKFANLSRDILLNKSVQLGTEIVL